MDRESQTHKPQTLSSFYSSKPTTGSQRSPSKHANVGGAAGGVSKHGPSSSSSSAAGLPAPSSSSAVVVLSGEGVADLKPVQNSTTGEGSAESREHGEKPVLLEQSAPGAAQHAFQDTYIHTSLYLKRCCNTALLTPSLWSPQTQARIKNTLYITAAMVGQSDEQMSKNFIHF